MSLDAADGAAGWAGAGESRPQPVETALQAINRRRAGLRIT